MAAMDHCPVESDGYRERLVEWVYIWTAVSMEKREEG
jgi:hypothetical protein